MLILIAPAVDVAVLGVAPGSNADTPEYYLALDACEQNSDPNYRPENLEVFWG